MTGCPGKNTVILREQKPIFVFSYFIIVYPFFIFFYHENNLLLYSTYFVSSNKLRSNKNIKRETPGNLRCRIRFDICPLGCRMPRDGPKGRATTGAHESWMRWNGEMSLSMGNWGYNPYWCFNYLCFFSDDVLRIVPWLVTTKLPFGRIFERHLFQASKRQSQVEGGWI